MDPNFVQEKMKKRETSVAARRFIFQRWMVFHYFLKFYPNILISKLKSVDFENKFEIYSGYPNEPAKCKYNDLLCRSNKFFHNNNLWLAIAIKLHKTT